MKKRIERRMAAAAFILPAGLLACMHLLSGAPGWMVGDMQGQYAAFYTYMCRALRGEAGLTYTFSLSMGAGTAGLWTYYLLSPVNWLCLCFSPERLPWAVMLMTMIKTGLCGLLMYTALPRGTSRAPSLACAVCYALGAYVLCYMQNLMWLDAVALFPPVMRALLAVPSGEAKDGVRYAALLALTLAVNYYIGYMVCIACVMAMAAYFVCRGSLRGVGRFAGWSLLAGALAAAVLAPAALALSGGKSGEAVRLTLALRYPDWRGLLLSFLPGEGGANAYVGVLCACAALALMGSKTMRAREKVCALLLVAALLLSFQVEALTVLWHGFQKPIGFPMRNAFILSALLVALAHRFLQNVRWPRWAVCLLSVVMAAEVSLVGVGTLGRVYQEAQSAGAYAQEYRQTQAALKQIPREDSFYRVEKTYGWADVNRAMTNGYASVSHFSSTQKQPVKLLLHRLGLYYETLFRTGSRADGGPAFFAHYERGATLALDTLLGIRYVLDDGSSAHVQALEKTGEAGDIAIYKNAEALPPGVLCGGEILMLALPEDDPYAAQEAVFAALTGQTQRFFTPVTLTQTLEGVARRENVYERTQEKGSVVYTFTAPEEGAYSAYVELGGSADHCRIYAGETDCGDYGLYRTEKIVPLGRFEAGETVPLRLVLQSQTAEILGVRVMREDEAAVRAAARATARPAACDISEGNVRFEVCSGEDASVLFTTIPMENGWEAYIDGEKAKIDTALEALIAVRVPEGEHTVTLRYHTPGLRAGALTTLAALALCVAVRRRKRKHV